MQHIIIFDGYCNLCTNTVSFIIKLDRRKIFQFASLQSVFAEQLLQKENLSSIQADSIVYFEKGKVYYKSEAVLRITRKLGGVMLVLQIGYLLPGKWRDGLYDFIARNRYKWFGKKDQCALPDQKISDRFKN